MDGSHPSSCLPCGKVENEVVDMQDCDSLVFGLLAVVMKKDEKVRGRETQMDLSLPICSHVVLGFGRFWVRCGGSLKE